jgi:hypothetical protein
MLRAAACLMPRFGHGAPRQHRENANVSHRLCTAAIAVMKAAHHRLRNDAAVLWRLDRSRLRSIVPQSPMRSCLLVIGEVQGSWS